MSQNKRGNKPLSQVQKRMGHPHKQEAVFKGRIKISQFFARRGITLN